MTTYLVTYTYSGDAGLRDEHRPVHREFLRDLAADGALLVAGPLPDAEPPVAVLVLRASGEEEVRELLREDPFQQQGLLESVQVQEWTTAVGGWPPSEG
ncbi:MAG TPA: YciI family protein [Ornithinimicrobium sp.]|uniref:YciI family protein n=1 Tax=Ornithinimicrobium sp. TaxID=1977084 RepID=UPI002B460AD0|nr:YciI family protein [Ornithinimicrobium sp.]HKJ11568.1 YciI family protein [Ornithinimicrobium sp.]